MEPEAFRQNHILSRVCRPGTDKLRCDCVHTHLLVWPREALRVAGTPTQSQTLLSRVPSPLKGTKALWRDG